MDPRETFIQRLCKSFLAFACFLSLLGCQPLPDRAKPLTALEVNEVLARGRVIHRLDQIQNQNMALSAATGPIYQMHIDPLTDELRWVLFDTDLMDAVDRADLVPYVDHWLTDHEQQFYLPQSITLTSRPPLQRELADGMLSLSFRQFVSDLEVKDAFVDFVFSRQKNGSWKLREIVNQASALPVDQSQPVLEFTDLLTSLNWSTAELISSRWLWRIDSVNNRLTLSKEFVVNHQEQTYTWTMDASDHKIIDGHRHRLAIRGQIAGEVYERTYIEEELVSQPLVLTDIYSGGQSFLSSSDGLIDSELTPTYAQLTGPRVRVYQGQQAQPEKVTLKANGNGSWQVDDPSKLAAVNAYAATQRINRFVRHFLSADEVKFLDKSIEVRVNVEGECNAFYTTGSSKITLYGQGGGCANLALINDVIYHEWGHGLNEHTGRQFGVADGAFSEGISDLTSALFTGDPEIGRGFVIGRYSGIRSVKNQRTYPYDVGDVHREGGIIAGSFWDLREELMERYGNKAGQYLVADLFFRHLLTSDTYHDSYQSVLRLDDDDGNPATRSRNFCLINGVFAARGLTEPLHCEDKTDDVYQKSAIDQDIFLAFAETEANQLGLVASSGFADRLAICFGSRYACLSQERTHFHFSSIVSAASSRRFFALGEHLPLKGLDLVTIIAKNSRGQVIGSRMVKLVQK